MPPSSSSLERSARSLHRLGVASGLTAGVWLGAAEAPTKLVTLGLSPFAVSLWMVAGVFTARWTFPTLLKGTAYVLGDLRGKKHLVVWALLAGALWAVANTLTVFAIRDVGLAVAFPLWNANSLFGLLWGRLLFRELEGAGARATLRVVLGAVAIVAAAILLGFTTVHGAAAGSGHALRGIVAALAASALWGAMYVPYRKAYLSGMNPLSFVTAFTFGELGSVLGLVWWLDGGRHSSAFRFGQFHGVLFWLFLGGFVWVVGDIFQQFAAKYLGIGRGIPLSNTNQLWGLAWGALVFGELAATDLAHRLLVLAGSALMILGAIAISGAVAGEREHHSRGLAIARECERYGLAPAATSAQETPAQAPSGQEASGQASAGEQALGQQASRQAESGQAASPQQAVGQAASGQTSGQETSGQEAVGQASSGQQASGQAESGQPGGRPALRWWDGCIVASALALFCWLGLEARIPRIALDHRWLLALVAVMLVSLAWTGRRLHRQTGFS